MSQEDSKSSSNPMTLYFQEEASHIGKGTDEQPAHAVQFPMNTDSLFGLIADKSMVDTGRSGDD